jgi:signal peptidase I
MTLLAGVLVLLAGMVLGALGVVVWIRRRYVVLEISGHSMTPLIHHGDRVRARRITPEVVRAGDVVAIQAPATHLEVVKRAPLPTTLTPVVEWEEVTPARERPAEQTVVKRVAAVAGDVVPEGLPGAGTRLAAGLVLVLGDNTLASIDSRHFGPLPLSGVLGRVELPGPPRSPSA